MVPQVLLLASNMQVEIKVNLSQSFYNKTKGTVLVKNEIKENFLKETTKYV